MEKVLFILIVAFVVIDFLLDQVLEFLNKKNWNAPIPNVLKDVIDAKQQSKTIAYQRANFNFNLVNSSVSFLLIMAMLIFQGFAIINQWAASLTENGLLQAIIFFGILAIGEEIISLPFSIYNTFIIEDRFGFNTTSKKTFFFDLLKNWGIEALLGSILFSIIYKIWEASGAWFWVIAWCAVSLLSIFMSMFYSNLIVPLFNKQTPLENGSLRSAIENFSVKEGFNLENIYVIDSSKRSTKANAYFTGLGAKKRIVLYDTLIDLLTEEEVVAVLAHEMGHYKKKHNYRQLIMGLLQTAVLFYILSLIIMNETVSAAIGVYEPCFHVGLLVFGLLYSPVTMILGIFTNADSRHCEFQADTYAKNHGLAPFLISALKKLSVQSLNAPTPHKAYVFFNYSHPDLASRIENLS